jgi:hypothetical protein
VPIDIYDDSNTPREPVGGQARPYLGVLFECCGVYARVYRRPDAPQYEGRCPKCLRELHVRVAADGVNTRLLRAR